MTRLKTFRAHCLLAAGLLSAVSTAQAKTYYHPLCDGSGDVQATSCTQLHATYVATAFGFSVTPRRLGIDRVEALISEDCRVAANEGTVTIFADEETHLLLPDTTGRLSPVEVSFVFPTGCAVKLHGRAVRPLHKDSAAWFLIPRGQNVGAHAYFELYLIDGDWKRTKVVE